MKIENIHFQNKQIPYDYLETLFNGLKEIASFPLMEPTQKIKNKYPNINVESRDIYVKAIPNSILYTVIDCGHDPKEKSTLAVNCKGYAIVDIKKGKLMPVPKLEKIIEMMDLQVGSDLIED
jgi:hypothetical protein